MPAPALMDWLPLWMFFPVTVLVVLGVIETGYRLGQYRRTAAADEKESPVGAMSAASLGLLAFFLAATFGFAASRFDERRHALIDETNAIGTCYLRAETLPPALRDAVLPLLRDYVQARIEGTSSETVGSAIAKSEDLHRRLWVQAVTAAAEDRSAVTALFVSSLNDVIDLHTIRVTYGLRSRIPGAIWLTLFLVTALSMGVMGYMEGLSRSSRSPAVLAVVLTFATVLTLIADLDRPGEGTLRLGPQLMLDLQQHITPEKLHP